MPATTPNPGATFVVYLIVLVAICFVMMLLFKAAVWWGSRYPMSSNQDEYDDLESNPEPVNPPATTTTATSNNASQSGATNSNELLIGQARALAAMVKAGKIGETEGIKMIFGVSPSSTNPRYIAARAALKDELAKLDPPKFRRSPEQDAAREALGLTRQN